MHICPIWQATPEASIFERAMLDRIPLDEIPPRGKANGSSSSSSNSNAGRSQLASPGNRVVLLGDAMHAAHSGPGQGARSAFEVHLQGLSRANNTPDLA